MSSSALDYFHATRLASPNRPSLYSYIPHSWEEVGIILPPDAAGEVRTPCPRCSPGRRKSRDKCLAIDVHRDLWFCHHCGWKGRLWRPESPFGRPTRRTPCRPAPPSPPPDADAARKRGRLKRVWCQGRPITPEDGAGRYLRRRGLWQPPLPAVLRFHPALPYHYDRDEHRKSTLHPALIAAIQGPDGRVVSLHRIYLTPDGHKADVPAPKKFMSPPTTLKGAAIRLDQATHELAITEGLETALAVRLSTGMPTWSALSAGGMETLWVPETAGLVVIGADHDVHGKGEEAARKLSVRLLENRHQVKILKPQMPGADWADGLAQEREAS